MIREGMSAMLPDYLVRGDEPLPPAVTEQLEKIRKEQGEELWTKLRYGDVAVLNRWQWGKTFSDCQGPHGLLCYRTRHI